MEKKVQYDKLVSLSKEKFSKLKNARMVTRGSEEESVDVLPIGEGSLIIDEVKVQYICCINVCTVYTLLHVIPVQMGFKKLTKKGVATISVASLHPLIGGMKGYNHKQIQLYDAFKIIYFLYST